MALRASDIARMEAKDLSRWAPKPKQRMAGDEIPAGLEGLLKEIREEGAEELRQEAIVQAMHPEVSVQGLINGSSRTAEQQVARGLLFDGVMPDVLPADRYAVADLADKAQLGVAGPFQSDSTVRQSTTGGLVTRNTEDGPEKFLEVDHRPILTEYLTPQTEARLYDAWRDLNPQENQFARRNFNALGGEYYGQQMLKAMGARPVADSQRSEAVRSGQRGRQAAYLAGSDRVSPADSTLGTNRLVENSVGLLQPDIDLSGDYRYLSNTGEVKVGDYQTGLTELRGRPVDTVRLNLIKSMDGATSAEVSNFKQNYAAVGGALKRQGINPTPDAVLAAMADVTLPPVKQGSYGDGIRGGKALSALDTFAEQNPVDQFRYDTVLYGLQSPGVRDNPRGMVPEEVIFLDNRKANEAIGKLELMPSISPSGSEINVTPKIKDLARHGAAARITQDPRIAQLLG